MKKNIFYILSILFFSSCYLLPCTFNSDLTKIDQKLTLDDVIGFYKIEKRTTNYVSEYSSGNAEILLKKNGEMYFKNLTEQTLIFDGKVNKYISGKAKWKLFKNNLNIEYKKNLYSWKFYKKNGILIITSDYYFDPDDCLFIRFKKEK